MSFCSTCYSCNYSRGFKRFSFWLASRLSCVLTLLKAWCDPTHTWSCSTCLKQVRVVLFPKRPQLWVASKHLLECWHTFWRFGCHGCYVHPIIFRDHTLSPILLLFRADHLMTFGVCHQHGHDVRHHRSDA